MSLLEHLDYIAALRGKHEGLPECLRNAGEEAAFLQLANGGLKVKVWDKVVGDAEIRYLGAGQFDIEALYKIKHYQLVAVRFVVEISGARHSNISFIRGL